MTLELSEKYKGKIKSPEELASILGASPRKVRAIMCHGVFDIVHPGHIRHFLFAKSKAPILVVSLTADIHINKGPYRPHIPEDLRAFNLAALDCVDYVIIDKNPTPLDNIGIVKPDLFVKGFEYSPTQALNPNTKDEIETVRSYGGEVIFSPGDFVLSSSKLISDTPPNLKYEKLLLLMNRAEVTFDDLKRTLDAFTKYSVHVVGDLIVDSYTRCSMIGGQTKTPTLSVRRESREDFVGGAGIVAAHLKAAGAKVSFSTVLGRDDLGHYAQKQLEDWGIFVTPILDQNRPTVNKNAIVVDDYRLLKIDDVDNRSITNLQVESLLKDISLSSADAFVFSDFRHGIFNKNTIPNLIKAIPENRLKVADSQVASRWGNILEFQGFDLITPNEREARFSLGDQDSGIRSLAAEIFRVSECKVLIMKLASRGVITCTNEDASTLDSYFVMDSFVDQLIDPVGAGDALLAYATLSMLSSKDPVIASILGNLAAACECEVDGNHPIGPADLLRKIDRIESEISFA
jgi:rfaE bifunctional protein kinase chain/domain